MPKYKAGDRIVIEAVVLSVYLNGYHLRIDGDDKDVVVTAGIDDYSTLKNEAVKTTGGPQAGTAPTTG